MLKSICWHQVQCLKKLLLSKEVFISNVSLALGVMGSIPTTCCKTPVRACSISFSSGAKGRWHMLAPMPAPWHTRRGSARLHKEHTPQLGFPWLPPKPRWGCAVTWGEQEKQGTGWSCDPLSSVIPCMRWFVRLYSVTVWFEPHSHHEIGRQMFSA